MNINDIKTPLADVCLQAFTFITKEGLVFNEIATHGQKVIMEIILNRGINNETMEWINRIHLMAHTRYGKSMAIAAAVSVRAPTKHEPWAILAPVKDQAQIIMDYILYFVTNEPLLSKYLATEARILQAERLTQRRSRSHVTFLEGGEIRVYASAATMGFGCKNIIEDEAGLVTNEDDSKIFRMLGDDMDNFLMKVGNPWFSIDENTGEEHHFFQSFKDPQYFVIDIPIEQGIVEGRVDDKFHAEVRKKPNYEILYQNTFPDTEQIDKEGYNPLLSHRSLKAAFVKRGVIKSVGDVKLAADPADGGENESVICKRSMNLARITYAGTSLNNLQFADKIVEHGRNIANWWVDKQGVGSGTVHKLEENASYFRRLNPLNTGLPVPENLEDHQQFFNLRAYIFWQTKLWIESGGKLEENPKLMKQLLALRYRNNSQGKVVIISKEKLHKRKIYDLGRADALSMTFAPETNQSVPLTNEVAETVKPYYPELGY